MPGEASQKNTSAPPRLPGQRGPRNVMPVEHARDLRKTLARLLLYFRKELRMVAALFVSVIFVVVCSVWAPKLQSNAIDKITDRQFGALPAILGFMALLFVIWSAALLIQTRLSARLSQRIVRRMREDFFDKIVNLPVKYLDTHSHGDIMSRMTNDVENISLTISQSISSLASGVLTVLGTAAMMVWFCWQLALLSCVTVLLTLAATRYLSKKMRVFFRRRQVLLGKLNGTVEEMVTGYRTVAAYNHQDHIIDDFEQTADELTKVGIRAEILGGSMGPVMNAINNVGFVIIAAFGGYFAIHGFISVGVISAFIVYAKQFGRPINEIAQLYGQIQTAIAGAERVFELMDQPDEDKSGEHDLSQARGEITFAHVDFSYTEGKQVLYDFSLKVRPGQKVALVGATGSGKTTVVNLLMRFYDIDSGGIYIDGVNIRDIDCSELRKNTAIVLQDTVLFSDTIRNNLKYSNPDASEEAMVDAAKMSNCHRMITRMASGYDTELTEAGQNLSQGQRQLLSIGRALLADPKILILDEATSSVDTRTEKNIQDAMVRLMENRTSLIIAHRLSTIQDADVIVVMDQGRIVEQGNHQELIAARGRYFQLYQQQYRGQAI